MTSRHGSVIDALVLYGAKDLRLEKRPAPQPGPGEVQVSIQATGLCGSDLHYYNHGRNGNFVLQHPMCLGHEAAGIVTAIYTSPETSGVDNSENSTATTNTTSSLQVGDRVALEVGIPCRQCTLCTTGRYNLCPKLRFRSSAKTHPHLDGTLQTSITHIESLCHKLPDNVSYEQGALVEPLAVSLHAINRSVSAGSNSSTPLTASSALVLGAGAVGILTAVALSVSGVSKILICDIDESRLKVASTLSNGRFNLKTFLLPKPDPSKPRPTVEEQLSISQAQAVELINHIFLPQSNSNSNSNSNGNGHASAADSSKIKGHNSQSSLSPSMTPQAAAVAAVAAIADGFDRTFECTGLPACVATSIHATKPGGKVILVGMGNPVQTLPLGAAALREIDIVGVFRYAGTCYPAAVELFASGKLDGVAEGVVSHRVSLTGHRGGGAVANRLSDSLPESKSAPEPSNVDLHLAFRLASNTASIEETGGRPVVKVMVVPPPIPPLSSSSTST